MTPFVHLHVHSEYSLLDGACRLGPLFDTLQTQGQTAVALTDHGNLFGAVPFYKMALERGIRPILGCEVYVAPRGRGDKAPRIDDDIHHLVLLCENDVGYHNLLELVSAAYLEGFYNKPRVDRELLERHHEGLIALSACLKGEIPARLLAGDTDAARETALWYDRVFGHGNFYLELQDHGLEEQRLLLPRLAALGEQTGIPLVATNDVHYLTPADARLHEVLLCVQLGRTVEDPRALRFESDQFYLKSGDEMAALFAAWPQAVANTVAIADRCRVTLPFGQRSLPRFPAEGDHAALLRRMCEEGLRRLYGDPPDPRAVERLEYELDVITRMGFVDYYLIVQDFIAYARAHGIPVGPGRGSGAGSLAAYCIGITQVDPLRYDLLFERFLNPERVSMPDFDVDLCYLRRGEVIDYVVRRYGADRVAQIVAFDTLKARAALRDIGRALARPYAEIDALAKQVPRELGITLARAQQENPAIPALLRDKPALREVWELAERVEGMPRHATTHAAGLVITPDRLTEHVPLLQADGNALSMYPMAALEDLGLLKIDLLGLRNLTILDDARRLIAAEDPAFSLDDLPPDDPATLRMMAAGQTDGVFQFESAGMRRVLQQLRPTSLEDLIAIVSLYRPGPSRFIPTFIENHAHPDRIAYRHPALEPILRSTYGCIVYQEQVMQICRELAGYTLGRADIVRRAMAKKKHDVMERERQVFLYGSDGSDGAACEGCLKRGVPEDVARALFDELADFSSYAFNKSHAAAYAVVSYRTAYLKCHYPAAFMAALLTSVLDNTGKLTAYIAECERLGLRVLPPHVNRSAEGFTVEPAGIRFGLLGVKSLGGGLIHRLLEERRQGGDFTSLGDFLSRMASRELNRRALECLIQSGSLDGLGHNRGEMLRAAERLLTQVDNRRRSVAEGQMGLFGPAEEGQSLAVDPGPDLPDREKWEQERQAIGVYLSGHPLMAYAPQAARLGAVPIARLTAGEEGEYADGASVGVLAIVTAVRPQTTKRGDRMAAVQLADQSGAMEMVVFPQQLAAYGRLLQEGGVLWCRGRLSLREEREPQLICDRLTPAAEADAPADPPAQASPPEPPARSVHYGLHLQVESLDDRAAFRCRTLLSLFPGDTPVYWKCRDTGRYVQAPREQWVALCDPVIHQLQTILGTKNVRILS